MKLIRKAPSSNALKTIEYDFNDEEYFKKRFSMKEDTAKRLCEYLKNKKTVVKMVEVYDSQAGWKGFEFWLEGRDLSLNGFCYHPNRVKIFLDENA